MTSRQLAIMTVNSCTRVTPEPFTDRRRNVPIARSEVVSSGCRTFIANDADLVKDPAGSVRAVPQICFKAS